MGLERLQEIEMIGLVLLSPWRPKVFSRIETEPDKEIAMECVEMVWSTSDIVAYSNALG